MADVINLLFTLLWLLILARIVLSWTGMSPYQNSLYRVIFDLTEPLMAPFRRLIPPMGGLDFSPILLLFLVDIVRRVLLSLVV